MTDTKLNDTNMVNSIAFMNADDGAHVEYEGPFEIVRDGGAAEVVIPVGVDDYAGIHEQTIENLSGRVGDLAVALADGSIEVSGLIEAAEVLGDEFVVRINDGNRVTPSGMDIDPDTLRHE